MPKNNKYKRRGSPEGDEQKMVVPVYHEVVPSAEGPRASDKKGYFKPVKSEQEIPPGERPLFEAQGRPNVVEVMREELSEMRAELTTLRVQVKDLRVQEKDLRVQMKDLRIKVKDLSIDKALLVICHLKKAMHQSLNALKIGGKKGTLRASDLDYRAANRLFEIGNDDEFVEFVNNRNIVAHPRNIGFATVDALIDEFQREPLSDWDKKLLNYAKRLVARLKTVPGGEDLLIYYNRAIAPSRKIQ